MKRFLGITLLCVMMVSLAACKMPKETVQNNTPSGLSPSPDMDYAIEQAPNMAIEPYRLTKALSDNLSIDAEISFDLNAKRSAGILQRQTEKIGQSAAETFFGKGRTETGRRTFNEIGQVSIEFGDNSYLNFFDNLNRLNFGTELSQRISYLVVWESLYWRYSLDQFPQNENLPFAAVSNIVSQAKNDINTIGLENYELSTVYTISHESLQEYQQYLIDNGLFTPGKNPEEKITWSWSQDDDSYLLIFENSPIDGIAVYNQSGLELHSGAIIDGSRIIAIYSARGCEYMEIENIHADNLKSDSQHELVSGNDAIGAVTDKYAGLITDSAYTITSVNLRYIHKATTEAMQLLIPVWVFTVDEKTITPARGEYLATENVVTNIVIIDATTGRELL